MKALNTVRGLSHDLEIPNHSVLSFLIVQKRQLGHIPNVALNAINGLNNVAEVIDTTQNIGLAHNA